MKPVELRASKIVDLGKGVNMAFRFIPAGEFRMGTRTGHRFEQPVHRVVISQDFWLAETPVTQLQYEQFQPEHKSHFQGKPDCPVERVSWNEARDFCAWLLWTLGQQDSRHLGIDLPTNAQWEYACRAGTESDYHTGDGDQALCRSGWFNGNSNRTVPVKRLESNDFGLYDMHGNVLEWSRDADIADVYRHKPDGVIDPTVNASRRRQEMRVARGGSWNFDAGLCRSASLLAFRAVDRVHILGFRVGMFPIAVTEASCEDAAKGNIEFWG